MEAEHQAWLDLVAEEALEPDLPICDPHHHLWDHPTDTYLLDELRADTGSGHNVVSTVFVECMSKYRSDGPEALRPVGETEFVAAEAARSGPPGGSVIAGIVGYADLTLGDAVEAVLAAHDAAGGGRFRGIRHATGVGRLRRGPRTRIQPAAGAAGGARRSGPASPRSARAGLSLRRLALPPPAPRAGRPGPRLPGHARWCSTTSAARSASGPYAGRRDEVFADLARAMAAAGGCPNVVVKLGGIGMPIIGFDFAPASTRRPPPRSWPRRGRPDPSACIEAVRRGALHVREQLPGRQAVRVLRRPVNAFKRIAAGASDAEKADLFHDTAARALPPLTDGRLHAAPA